MDRICSFVVISAVSITVAVLVAAAVWKLYWTAVRPLLQALSGIQ